MRRPDREWVIDVLVASAWAALLSSFPSTLYALFTDGDPLEATRAAGAMLISYASSDTDLILAAAVVHVAITLFWAFLIAWLLPRADDVRIVRVAPVPEDLEGDAVALVDAQRERGIDADDVLVPAALGRRDAAHVVLAAGHVDRGAAAEDEAQVHERLRRDAVVVVVLRRATDRSHRGVAEPEARGREELHEIGEAILRGGAEGQRGARHT